MEVVWNHSSAEIGRSRVKTKKFGGFMSNRKGKKPGTVRFIKSSVYLSKVSKCLNAEEEDALYNVLAVDPLRGRPSTAHPAILEFGPFSSHYVYYVLRPSMDEIHILEIRNSPLPPIPIEGKGVVAKVIEKGLIAGALVIAKEGIIKLWEVIREYLSQH